MPFESHAENQAPHADTPIDTTAPVGIEMVRAAIGQLEAAGQPVTRRAVRLVLGKGSLRTIHDLMTEIETVREEKLDRIDLTDEDRRVILDFGARSFSLMRWRLETVTKGREEALQKQADAYRQRAEEVIELAEADVAVAKAAADLAVAGQRKAEQARDEAVTETKRQAKEAERAAGQVALLLEERDVMRQRLEGTEERLTRAIAAQEAEAEEVGRLEKQLDISKAEIERLHSGREEMVGKLGEKDVEIVRLQIDAKNHAHMSSELSTKLSAELAGHEMTKADLARVKEKVAKLTEKVEAADLLISEMNASLKAERQRADLAEQKLAEVRGSDVLAEEVKKLLESMRLQDATITTPVPGPQRKKKESKATT